ncbi:MAG: hypothetical protein HYV14_11330 [Elusimicrobia bacterium]|nr:hypothetical protein [Elusimicrobiota bacterium]
MGFLFLLLLAAPAAAYDLPALPIYVELHGGSPICGSQALLDNLNSRFTRVTSSNPDLHISCREGENLILEARTAAGKGIARFTVEISQTSKPETLAYLGAAHLAKDRDVIDAALLAHNANLAEPAAEYLAQGDLLRAASHFTAALESDLDPRVLYYGLYLAAARGGRLRDAKWHLAAFSKSSDLDPRDLTDEQLRAFIEARNAGGDRPGDADAIFREYENAARAHKWNEALYHLRRLLVDAPWYEPAYHALAQTYEAAKWKRLAKHWEKRASFVRRLNKDAGLGEDIEKRLAL